MQEEVMDIAGLLAKLTDDESLFVKFAETLIAHHQVGLPDPGYSLPNGVEITYHGGIKTRGRRFTLSMASIGLSLRFRFSGHHKVEVDKGGIASFLHPDFLEEFLCELGSESLQNLQCGPLHAIVLNSGEHDLWHAATNNISDATHLQKFADNLDKLLALVTLHSPTSHLAQSARNETNTASIYPSFWRGNTMDYDIRPTELLREMDNIARSKVLAIGIPFVDVAAVLGTVPNFPACCTISKVHLGMHEYSKFSTINHVRNKFTATSLVTNALLRTICPRPQDIAVP